MWIDQVDYKRIVFNITNNMDKLKEYKYILAIAVFILSFTFYWFEWRPAQIIKLCGKDAEFREYNQKLPNGIFVGDAYEYFYDLCLKREGLKTNK